MSGKKTLVVVLCETRAYSQTFAGFKQNLLDVFDADLALCIAQNDRENPDNPFYQTARYIWTCPEHDDWGDAFEQLMPDLHPRWRDCAVVGSQWMGGIDSVPKHPGSGGIIFYFRMLLRSRIMQESLLAQYDRFIVTRSDFKYEIPHPPPGILDNGYIWIPDGEQYGGYTDRHVVCPSRNIIDVLSVADLFKEDPHIVIERMKGCNWNPERVLKDHLERKGLSSRIKLMPYVMYSVREEGGHTSWSSGHYDQSRRVYIKYPDEMRRANFAKKVLNNRSWSRNIFIQVMMLQKVKNLLKTAGKFPSRLLSKALG